ncbi:hypothetical protein H9L39_04033 [Fusarium oxysporum f. sp. albedinis]|nr:hypothetical protein H9L39_04033 [Fusarium oxysporum f. sp. albedinis]
MGERLSPSTVDGRDTEDSRSKRSILYSATIPFAKLTSYMLLSSWSCPKRDILHAPIYDEDADISHPHVGKEMEEKMLPHRQQMKGARISNIIGSLLVILAKEHAECG